MTINSQTMVNNDTDISNHSRPLTNSGQHMVNLD